METAGTGEIMAVYLLFWAIVAWFSGYARHTRETARLLEHKLAPAMPEGTRIHLSTPWYARLGLLENALVIAVLGYGLALLAWAWILAGFAVFLFAFLPFATRFLTPHPGAPHYIHVIRRELRLKLAKNEERGDREGAELYRIAMDRIDHGL